LHIEGPERGTRERLIQAAILPRLVQLAEIFNVGGSSSNSFSLISFLGV